MKIEDKWIQEACKKAQKKTQRGWSKARTTGQEDTPKRSIREAGHG